MPRTTRSGSHAASAVVFAPFDATGRAELVERRLTDAIVLGLLPDGERLPSEANMARSFGVATVTAREALEALREKGLVETRRGRDGGSFVTAGPAASRRVLDDRLRALTRVDLRDMGTYYGTIAAGCAALAAEYATEDDIERLRAIALVPDESETAARRRQGSMQLEIAALSQSTRLVREELRMQAEFAPLLWLELREPEYRRRNLELRESVIDALAAADGERARALTLGSVADAIAWLLDTKSALEAS